MAAGSGTQAGGRAGGFVRVGLPARGSAGGVRPERHVLDGVLVMGDPVVVFHLLNLSSLSVIRTVF